MVCNSSRLPYEGENYGELDKVRNLYTGSEGLLQAEKRGKRLNLGGRANDVKTAKSNQERGMLKK